MQLLLLLIALSVFVTMVIGLVRPSVVRMPNREKVFLIYGLSSVVLLVIAAQVQPEPREQPASHNGQNHIEVKRQVPPQPNTEAVDVDAVLRENQEKMAELRASRAYKPPTDQRVLAKQEWVLDHCIAGDKWDIVYLSENLGDGFKIPYTGNMLREGVIKAYYFPAADMTLLWNSARDTIATVRFGKDSS